MKEIRHILQAYSQVDWKTQKAAMATVVKVHGSSYRRPGARMFITDDGRFTGAISGGCLEGDALSRASQIMCDGEPRIVTYDTSQKDGEEMAAGLGCNGIIDVLIEPLRRDRAEALFDALGRAADANRAAWVVSLLRCPHDFAPGVAAVFSSGQISPLRKFPAAAEDALSRRLHNLGEKNHSFIEGLPTDVGEFEFLFEYIRPSVKLYLFGGGYDMNPLIRLAKTLGWAVTVANDCPDRSDPALYPEADDVVKAERNTMGTYFPWDLESAAVIMSHNYNFDIAVLESLLRAPKRPPYIALLGPRKRFNQMREEIGDRGTAFSWDEVHNPAGLDLGAETPDEIALSITSEILAGLRGRSAGMLKDKTGFIHDRKNEKDLSFA